MDRLHNLRVIKYGSTLHIDCHLTLPWYLNISEAHRQHRKFSRNWFKRNSVTRLNCSFTSTRVWISLATYAKRKIAN